MPELFLLQTDRVSLAWSGRTSPPTVASGSYSERGRLSLSPGRAGLEFTSETWRGEAASSGAVDVAATAGPMLFEETAYSILLSAREGHAVALYHRDPTILRGLTTSRDKTTVHGTINFRSQVGRSRFSVLVDGQPEFDFEVEVAPSKLDYETDYAELTAEVQSFLTGLVLQYLGSTSQAAVPEGATGGTELEWVLILRHVVDDLERALHYVARRPIRGLRRTQERVRVERVRRIDSHIRRSVARGKGSGQTIRLSSGLPIRQHLDERQARPTLDTPEHRWLATKLSGARARIAELRHRTASRGRRRSQTLTPLREKAALDELEVLEHRLTRLCRLEPLEATEGPPPQGFSSLQLQGAPGYREAYHACLMLSRGLRLSGGPVDLSLKDLHLLYEYWCFLALLRIVGEVLEQPIRPEQLLSVEQDGLRVRLQQGRQQTVTFDAGGHDELAVTYSQRFEGNDYLLPQKPDIVLTLRRDGWPTIQLVLDAKYRLDASDSFVDRMGAPGPPFDAINVLHRYRDAILESERVAHGQKRRLRTVVEGAALFPLGGHAVEDFTDTKMWKSLNRLGIGAIPFLPSETGYVREWLTNVLDRTGWAVADRVAPSAVLEHVHQWRKEAAEPVLIGVLRSDEDSHIRWIKERRLYYTPFTPSQHLQLAAKWVAFYRRASAGKSGGVTLVAPVESIGLVPRSAIVTPWTTARDPGAQQVLYTLGEIETLPMPVLNRRGDSRGVRFSTNRWTSRLGLTRASCVSELALETEPEWRLYEELRLRGMAVEVQPGRPTRRDEADPKGRAWVRCAGGQAQYRGLAGWVVVNPEGRERSATRVDVVVEALCADHDSG